MNKQDEQKLTAIRGIDPGLYHRAKMAALQGKVKIGTWINDAIREKLNRDKGG
ncbi:hypothetical protein LCGC14_3142060 [marine sediment metagenome]|uniref:Uncharacterized protein n=1 Tax=marine sediment metagenome TaxID=412755 RepID=A0A0F8YKW5_9ZZZZ